MMQSKLFFPTFPTSHDDQDMIIDGVFFSPSFASAEDSPVVSSDSFFLDTFPDDLFGHDDSLVKISRSDIDNICDWIHSSHCEDGTSLSAAYAADGWSPAPSLESSQNTQILPEVPLNMPMEDTKLDNELRLTHLIKAFGEAMHDGNNVSLAKVIVESINEKSSPQGTFVERVAYNMFKSKDDEYLRQESIKNFATALNVLYQTLISGRFAHNAANAAILESVPVDATLLHIVDFDIGKGIQWPALIEALSRCRKPVRLTAIKHEGEEDEMSSPSCWEFEDTKKWLIDHARHVGLELQIEEQCIQDFKDGMKGRKNGGGRDWLVFNCMAALPHMGRRSGVVEFLKAAEELLGKFDGILTVGDGEAGVKLGNQVSFECYYGKLVEHYEAIFEALECKLPYLGEGRAAVECLFLAPFMCPFAWFDEWKEKARGLEFECGLEGRKASGESVAEARVMVGEGESWYSVRIEGLRENEMVLRWKEIVLVRVSTFCSRIG
ncbi:protein NODULATION SIGNALING PATHWAY 2-like [Salvia divinorum]|uniref:Protein NODULATION SIGNALING PATHWAY 2-like n=1 Tax=Salvia divinorum TaxID=28513 RepID=A0ABD1GIN9_SALDI